MTTWSTHPTTWAEKEIPNSACPHTSGIQQGNCTSEEHLWGINSPTYLVLTMKQWWPKAVLKVTIPGLVTQANKCNTALWYLCFDWLRWIQINALIYKEHNYHCRLSSKKTPLHVYIHSWGNLKAFFKIQYEVFFLFFYFLSNNF